MTEQELIHQLRAEAGADAKRALACIRAGVPERLEESVRRHPRRALLLGAAGGFGAGVLAERELVRHRVTLRAVAAHLGRRAALLTLSIALDELRPADQGNDSAGLEGE